MTHESGQGAAPEPTGPGLAVTGLVGGLIGLATGFALAWAIGGNPLGATNAVHFVELTVETVSEEGDRLCWAEEPGRRDSPLQCAVLALDPAVSPPQAGEDVTIGLVELAAPDGTEIRQIVHVGPVAPREAAPSD
jgi:hypothetical protein